MVSTEQTHTQDMFLDQILDDEIKLEVAVDNHPNFMCGILNGYVLNLYAKRCKLSRIQEGL